MTEVFNIFGQKEQRRLLRRDETETEKILWNELRNSKLLGYKFRRQYGIGPYIVDFYCASAKIVIEIDGGIHDEVDIRVIEALGLRVIRFRNEDIQQNIESVLQNIIPLLTKERVG